MEKGPTLKEYIQNVEETLYQLLEQNKYKSIPFPKIKNKTKNYERKLKRYYKIIISILYKQLQCNNEYDKENNGIIKYIIEELEKNINNNNFTQTYILLTSYSTYILEEMKKYFKAKHQNYILKKLPLQRICDQKQHYELFKNNLFLTQECYEYYLNPLTLEEQLIGEILEMKNETTKKTNSNSIAQNILIDMVKKYKGERFNEVLLFIICNVYQNALEENNEELINLTKYSIENSKVKNQEILDYFIDKEGNNTHPTNDLVYVIQEFIRYNENIKEGYLEHLTNRPSNQYVKERLKKPN